jgi:NAD(P)-dependent dehydrogenase (short-subunit alcohol dehydrogenase family)
MSPTRTKGYASQIINVTSISGIMKGSSGGQFAYAASKEAAVQMSKVMATEFLPLKIRVNQIAVRPERQRLLIVARHIPV